MTDNTERPEPPADQSPPPQNGWGLPIFAGVFVLLIALLIAAQMALNS